MACESKIFIKHFDQPGNTWKGRESIKWECMGSLGHKANETEENTKALVLRGTVITQSLAKQVMPPAFSPH